MAGCVCLSVALSGVELNAKNVGSVLSWMVDGCTSQQNKEEVLVLLF